MPVIPEEKLKEFLTKCGNCVVLRNHDFVKNLSRGGDIDVLVGNKLEAEQLLIAYLGPPLWVARRSYVTGYFFPWGHIDLLPVLEWHGAIYLANAQVFREAKQTISLHKPRLAHEALVCWFSNFLWGGFFKERYREVIQKAAKEDSLAFRQALISAVGNALGVRLWKIVLDGKMELSLNWIQNARRAVYWSAFLREPWGTLNRWIRFWQAEVALRLQPPVPWVAVLGPDGCGKSSVLSELKARLTTVPKIFINVELYHWRPGLLNPGPTKTVPVTDPHLKAPRGLFASVAKLGLLFLDWFWGYWTKLVHLRARGTLVLFDRHFLDILVDPIRYRYGGPAWLAKLANQLIPQPTILILLDAPAEVMQRRKREVPFEESVRQRADYLRLVSALPNGIVIDASKPIDDVVAKVTQTILRHLRKQTEKQLHIESTRTHS